MGKIYAELSQNVPEVNDEKLTVRKQILQVLDSCVSMFIVSPLVIACWRGIWQLIDQHYGEHFPLWHSLIICFLVVFGINYTRPLLNSKLIENTKHIKSIGKTLTRILITRVYHYVFLFACIMIWRCIWNIVPTYWGEFEFVCRDFIHPSIHQSI